jgi:tetratricopeptide (TPR) repeat protein
MNTVLRLPLRNTRKTGAVSSAPPEGLASSFLVWRRASAPFALLTVLVLLQVSLAATPDELRYAGPEACATCHRAIASTQDKTAMASTWLALPVPLLSAHFDERKTEGTGDGLRYEVRRVANRFEFSVVKSGGKVLALPVDAVVGGHRHGVSFLLHIDQIDGIPLERPAVLEGRYAFSLRGSLVLSPGFPTEKPTNVEDMLGRSLSPRFEERCLACHGEPNTLGAGKPGGVRCESCHGPALAHVSSFSSGNRAQVRPDDLKGAKSMAVCAQCHSGLSLAGHSDPLPDDVLVSSQVPALRASECFIQSGENLKCTDCHNPHQDSAAVSQQTTDTCLRCHSAASAQHAAICPINATHDCIGCHMPSIEKNSFRLTDHWIRVHPEQGIEAKTPHEELRSTVTPKREFLRIIAVENSAQADAAQARLAKGESFGTVAHAVSIDPTAPGGGYIGGMELKDMSAKLAAAAANLPYGGTSGIVDSGDRHIILQRLPRDFKWKADQLFQQASALKERGDLKGAILKDQEALGIYPYFLRALVLMGAALGEAGDAARASEVLRFAVQSYPRDASAQFNLALTLGKKPAEQIEALRRVIDLDPDLIATYESMGAALYSTGQAERAISVFHQGLQIDPLSATLYYDLGLALKQQGDEAASKRALTLAGKLDPGIAARSRTPQ